MWEINVGNQVVTLAFSLCLGGISCALYDVLRASRKAGFNSFITVLITDIIFWIVSAFITFIFLMARTYGEIRAYVFMGELIGFVLYRFTLSRLIFPLFKIFFEGIQKVRVYFNTVLKILYYKTESTILKFYSFVAKNFKRVIKSIKKLLKSRRNVLYTNENNNHYTEAEYVLNETKT